MLGWDGIQLDLESLRRHDGPGLVKLVRRLRADLPDGVAISMAAMAERSRAAYGRHGYRLGGLGAFDRFVLMAFDQHGPGRSGPGPVGALQWARRTAKPLVATWHPRAGEWSARVAKGTVWWSDHRSYVRRVALADDLGVHGVAVWQLGSADPLG